MSSALAFSPENTFSSKKKKKKSKRLFFFQRNWKRFIQKPFHSHFNSFKSIFILKIKHTFKQKHIASNKNHTRTMPSGWMAPKYQLLLELYSHRKQSKKLNWWCWKDIYLEGKFHFTGRSVITQNPVHWIKTLHKPLGWLSPSETSS